MTEQIIYIIIGGAVGAVAVWLLSRKMNRSDNANEQFIALQRLMSEQLDRVGQQVDRRLQENVRAMNESKDFLANRVSAAERSVRSVSVGLGKLAEATTTLQKTSDEIASFQTMLRSPKVRGSFGEVLLGNLMTEVLPQDRFDLQYVMRSTGEIADAVIKLQDGHIVAIDAKFPLANYEAFMHEQEEEQKIHLRKEWLRDVKRHIKDISKKYISSQEQTLDYAFMYIPLEGVYYETMVKDADGGSLWEFCLAHHVIPVSPNSFLAYLQTVLVGLRGMKIEQQAREILQHIGQLRQDFGKFAEDFTTVGTHLTNAKNRYDDSARRLDKFTNRLDQIETNSEAPVLVEKIPVE
ncbi:MAG: DNA recombination protein RmuC [Candidatus Andersenbacteria bacterium]